MSGEYSVPVKLENDVSSLRNNYFSVCQCCCSEVNLKSMKDAVFNGDNLEVYIDMLYFCFSIKLEDREDFNNMICEECIFKLRYTQAFKLQVELAQERLGKLRGEPIKPEYLDITHGDSVSIKNEDIPSDNESTGLYRDDSDNLTMNILKVDFANSDVDVGSRKSYKKKKKKRIKKFSEKDKVLCGTCQEAFYTKRSLSRHLKTHSQLFICHVCGRECPTKKSLVSHIISHSTEKVQCHICNKKLKKGSLLRHVQQHSGHMFRYPCKLCPERFPSYNNRLHHLAVAHGVEEKKYACKVCDKAFRFSGGLSAHVKRCHLQEKKCVCTECDKSFFSKNELLAHMLKHTKARLFQCEVCLKSYGRKSTLRSHIKIHSNIKAHKCSICFREFTQKCTLTYHMKVHEKINPLHQEK